MGGGYVSKCVGNRRWVMILASERGDAVDKR